MKIPPEILGKFENATHGLDYGSVTLSLVLKNGKARFLIKKEESFLSENEEQEE